MPVAIVPVDRAFALWKSTRVSTAGAIRARYHGTTRRVLFKASSVHLSKDARVTASEGESNRDSFQAPEYQRGRAEEKQRNQAHLHPPLCDKRHSRHYLRHMQKNAEKLCCIHSRDRDRPWIVFRLCIRVAFSLRRVSKGTVVVNRSGFSHSGDSFHPLATFSPACLVGPQRMAKRFGLGSTRPPIANEMLIFPHHKTPTPRAPSGAPL